MLILTDLTIATPKITSPLVRCAAFTLPTVATVAVWAWSADVTMWLWATLLS